MRARHICFLVVTAAWATPARADDSGDACLDASERARASMSSKRLLDARAQLRLCAASHCEDSVRLICDERLTEIAARLPSIIFDAKDRAGRDLPAVKLTIDGTLHSEGALGAEITLDPGVHVFVFEAPGEVVVEHRLVLVEREKGRREHVVFGREAPATPPPHIEAPAVPRTNPWRTAGWITVAAGAVGVGIGSAFGVTAISKNADAGCDDRNVCDDPRSRDEARTAADVSTVSFIAGAGLACAGLALVIFGPTGHSASYAITPSASGLSIARRW